MANNDRYSSVSGFNTPFGFVYLVNGDNMYAMSKGDCRHRIDMLFNGGVIGKERKSKLIQDLKAIRRGT